MSTTQAAAWACRISGPDGPRPWFAFEGDKPLTLGQSSGAMLRLDDSEIFRSHAVLEPSPGGGWTVRDLGNRNGLRVNARSATVHPLQHGDVIEIVRFKCFFGHKIAKTMRLTRTMPRPASAG